MVMKLPVRPLKLGDGGTTNIATPGGTKYHSVACRAPNEGYASAVTPSAVSVESWPSGVRPKSFEPQPPGLPAPESRLVFFWVPRPAAGPCYHYSRVVVYV